MLVVFMYFLFVLLCSHWITLSMLSIGFPIEVNNNYSFICDIIDVYFNSSSACV